MISYVKRSVTCLLSTQLSAYVCRKNTYITANINLIEIQCYNIWLKQFISKGTTHTSLLMKFLTIQVATAQLVQGCLSVNIHANICYNVQLQLASYFKATQFFSLKVRHVQLQLLMIVQLFCQLYKNNKLYRALCTDGLSSRRKSNDL